MAPLAMSRDLEGFNNGSTTRRGATTPEAQLTVPDLLLKVINDLYALQGPLRPVAARSSTPCTWRILLAELRKGCG